ncbi:MAG: NUDIX domain-containing protein, partial [Methylococcales bacterium]
MQQAIIATVDVVLFSVQQGQLQVLLIQRSNPPAEGRRALPGGFVYSDGDSDLLQAAKRVIGLKTGIDPPYLEQVASVGNAERDPRGWSITILYFALMSPEQSARFAEDASLGSESWAWVPVDQAQKDQEL